MRFVVDECTGPYVASWLREQGYDVVSIFDDAPGSKDSDILRMAYTENRILITNDRDFGEKVFREGAEHHGIIFLRIIDQRSAIKISVIADVLARFADQLVDRFVVITEDKIRFARLPEEE